NGRDGPGPGGGRDGPTPGQAAQLADLLRRLNVTFEPIAAGSCDHRHREDRYTPSRTLKHLTRARTATCPAPGCGAQAYYCDLDHTRPYPDGITCECELAPLCRRHHRCKQAPGWRLEQPEPGHMRWTTPAGRVYTTTPTVYAI
uniref:HNH endonuclease signature motif containing protein n=1 Tax=Trebonia sp. TaxID=2767075 RepID=UPI00260E8111